MNGPRNSALLALALAFTAIPLAAQSLSLDNLYQSNHWFDFRDAMLRQPAAAPFYRGQLDLAFHDWTQAEKELQSAMNSAAEPMQAFEAGMGLMRIYDLTGRRKDGRELLARIDALMQAFGKTRAIDRAALREFESYRAQLTAVSGYPDQSIAARGRSRLLYAEVENKLIVPLEVNGVAANYVIDTGSESCVISVAEAKRLGLTVHPAQIEIGGFDSDSEAAGVAVAPDVLIGNFHLRNVLFLVEEGDGADGIIGMPALLALETLVWNSDGTMEFGFPPAPRDLAHSNLCFAGAAPWTLAELDGKPLMLGLDTGSFESMLFPRFAREFAYIMKTAVPLGRRDAPKGTDAVALTNLRVGGLRTPLIPAPVYANEPFDDASDLHGWLGMDVLAQARSVTLDFSAMRLTLDGVDGAGGVLRAAAECALPPDFRCLPGFDCIVKAADTAPCFVERVPSQPPPGNPVTSEPEEAGNCYLTTGASCGHGMFCRAVFDSNQACHVVSSRAAPEASDAAPPALAPPVFSAGAPKPSAAVDARDIVARSVKYESLDLGPPRDYIYIEEEEQKLLKRDGSVMNTTSEAREVMHLYGADVTRLIRKNGKELPPAKARAEQARFDKAVEKHKREQAETTPEAIAKRQEALRKRDAGDLLCWDEFLKAFEPRVAGSEILNGRPSWIVELNPAAGMAPRCTDVKKLINFHFKVWIDQAEYRWARVEADNVAPVSWGRILVRVPAGGLHIVDECTRHKDGAWLASEERVNINAKLLLSAAVRLEDHTTYSDYRKFQAESTVR